MVLKRSLGQEVLEGFLIDYCGMVIIAVSARLGFEFRSFGEP